jgi:hypothetical protein
MVDQPVPAATKTDAQYDAEITLLMKKIGFTCHGQPIGVVACALFNSLCYVAETGTPALRKTMLESTAELVANIEAVDAAKH